jgi:hypothetical protein
MHLNLSECLEQHSKAVAGTASNFRMEAAFQNDRERNKGFGQGGDAGRTPRHEWSFGMTISTSTFAESSLSILTNVNTVYGSSQSGASIAELTHLLGRDRVLRRVQRLLSAIQKNS